MRGNRVPARPRDGRQRSIPACAGEPQDSLNESNDTRVYPRVCGGTDLEQLAADVEKGLSPRVRGNRLDESLDGKTLRSIPACAGEPPGCC